MRDVKASATYTPTALDAQLLFACGVTYFIQDPNPGSNIINGTTAAPYYDGTGFTSGTTPTFITGLLPQTAACMIGQITSGNTNYILIAFRGTEFTQVNDWSTDLMAEPIQAAGFGPTGAMVHSGFYLSLMEIMPQIQTQLNSLLTSLGQNTAIAITGHSKGGGMASLAAYYLLNNNTPQLKASQLTVTTFAAPNPGNGAFTTAFQAQITQTNFANYLDIVPWLPLTPSQTSDLINELPKLISDQTILPFITSILKTFSSWNYSAAASVVQFINEPTLANNNVQYSLATTTPGDEGFWALLDIASALTTPSGNQDPNYEAILAAHSHGCGGAYMFAICPSGTCPNPSTNCGVAPTVNPITDQTVNAGSKTVGVDFAGSLPGTVYNWVNTATSIGLAASGSGNIAAFTAAGSGNVVATITVTPVFTFNGISTNGSPVSFTITVSPS